MKSPTRSSLTLIAVLGVSLLIIGCSSFKNGSPPTAFEEKLFNVQTNYLPVVVAQTNIVPVYIYRTNVVPVVTTIGVNQFVTNFIPVAIAQTNFQPVTAYVTNQVPQYSYAPNSTTNSIEAAVSGIPVYGTLASTAIAGLAAVWGWFRSSKQGTAAATLAQGTETILEFIKQLPNGSAYNTALQNWLQSHQADTGALDTVMSILERSVSNPDAQIAAQQVRAEIAALNPALIPTASPAPPKA